MPCPQIMCKQYVTLWTTLAAVSAAALLIYEATPSACVRSTNPKTEASEESQMKDSADGPQASEPTGEFPFRRCSDVERFPEAV